MARLSAVTGIVPLNRRSVGRFITSSVLCALVLIGTSALAGAASKASAAKISAHLTETSFTKARAKYVQLIYGFSATSKSFGYLLSFKKSSKWQTVRSVKKTGTFRGSFKTGLKWFFPGSSVKVGEYRLKLFADGGSTLLSFTVKGNKPANTVLPTISGATRRGQALTASKGSWKYAPTSYAYRWRRCNSAGASCSNIAGARTNSYRRTAADVAGSTVFVVVTATNSYGSTSAISAPMVVGATIRAIGAGYEHMCALSSSGTVKCWGYNGAGQLGNGTKTYNSTPTPVQVKGVGGTGTLANVTQISAGFHHTCAFSSAGTVKCWGFNDSGQLGNGTTTQSSTPVQVKDVAGAGTLSNVTQISAGGSYICALLADNTVACWGDNEYGQLGNGTTADSSTPVQVKDATGTGTLSNVSQISVGHRHTCALLTDHTVDCWGESRYGELGNGARIESLTPVKVKGVGGRGELSNVTQIRAGGYHTCAVRNDRKVDCWGWNYYGQLGNGVEITSSHHGVTTPVRVKGVGNKGTLSKVTQISVSFDHTCALLTDHVAYCWGDNGYGQLGNGTAYGSSTPVKVKGVGGMGTF